MLRKLQRGDTTKKLVGIRPSPKSSRRLSGFRGGLFRGGLFRGELSEKGRDRFLATSTLVFVALLATWMGGRAAGGYYVAGWGPPAFILGAVALLISVAKPFSGGRLRWALPALGLFTAYTGWTFASILWSPNRENAWVGSGQTLLYLLAFWVALALLTMGASRRWVLVASVLGPSVVAALTLMTPEEKLGGWFIADRFFGTVGYFNGEAAFLLVPFWVAIYLGGSKRIHPLARGAVLAGAVLCVSLAVLTQSRGAMLAMAASLPVFFLFSGGRLRGLFALAPIALALSVTFPGLNDVYLTLLEDESPVVPFEEVLPSVWLGAAGAALYGLLWGIADRLWSLPVAAVRVMGATTLAGVFVAAVFGLSAFNERFGDPVTVAHERWEAFKADDVSGYERSRYLSASGSGRYELWRVAWKDFESEPVFGIGTHNYDATYYQLREKDLGWVRQPHMLPLEVLAERGIVGGILFFAFLAVCLVGGLWRRFTGLGSEGRALVGALVAAVTYWFVHSSAEWFWQLPAVTLPATLFLAMLVAPWNHQGNRRRGEHLEEAEREPPAARGSFRPFRPFRRPLRAMGAILGGVAVVVVIPLYLSHDYLLQSYALYAKPKAALRAVERAQDFNPLDSDLYLREAEFSRGLGRNERAEAAYRRAIQLNPEHYAPYVLLAEYYDSRARSEEALRYYRKAKELNPLDEEIEGHIKRLEGKTRL